MLFAFRRMRQVEEALSTVKNPSSGKEGLFMTNHAHFARATLIIAAFDDASSGVPLELLMATSVSISNALRQCLFFASLAAFNPNLVLLCIVYDSFPHPQASSARKNKAEVEKARKTIASMADLRDLPPAAKASAMKVCVWS